jgi:hypothetical protein
MKPCKLLKQYNDNAYLFCVLLSQCQLANASCLGYVMIDIL